MAQNDYGFVQVYDILRLFVSNTKGGSQRDQAVGTSPTLIRWKDGQRPVESNNCRIQVRRGQRLSEALGQVEREEPFELKYSIEIAFSLSVRELRDPGAPCDDCLIEVLNVACSFVALAQRNG